MTRMHSANPPDSFDLRDVTIPSSCCSASWRSSGGCAQRLRCQANDSIRRRLGHFRYNEYIDRITR